MLKNKKYILFLITIISIFITFLVLEVGYRFLVKSNIINLKVMLYQVGKNFKNEKDFVIYQPNQSIRHMTLFTKEEIVSPNDIIIETDYNIETNNLGLVMKKDIYKNDRVLLVIGDSFTEGQGAEPWFYDLEKNNYFNTKLMNLGIMGSGPMGWLSLTNHLKEKNSLNIDGVIINIILPDLYRLKWTHNENQKKCLYEGFCNYRGAFQGIDFKKYKSYEEIIKYEFLNKNRKIGSGNDIIINSGVLAFTKSILKQSKLLKDMYYGIVRNYFQNPKILKRNIDAISKINEIAYKNLYVNIITTKNINKKNYTLDKNYKLFFKYLNENKIDFSWCEISIDGFHKFDDHPNKIGYKKIRDCTSKSILNLNNKN